MRNAIHRISLDIHDTASQAVISVKKGDSKRRIIVVFTEDGKPYPIDSDCTATMRFKKPDGTVVYSACSVGLSGVVCDLTTQTTAAVGSVGCEITLYGADKKQITSPRFEMIVDDTVYSDSEVESSDEFSALEQAMAQFGGVSGATQRAEAAAEAAVSAKENASESASISMINKEAAISAKGSAESAAATATEKANAASSSASAAAASKTDAETAAETATSKASAASQAKSAAESAAAVATTKASEASASAANAAAAGKMQLIRQITTTAEAQTISLNKDNSDAAFSCDKVFLIVQFPAAIKLGTGGQTFYITETTGKTRYLYYAGTAHTTLILRMTAEVLGAESDAALGMTQIAFSQYDWSEDSINFGRTASGLTAIKSLVVGFEGSYKIPVGTIIKLYGRRA